MMLHTHTLLPLLLFYHLLSLLFLSSPCVVLILCVCAQVYAWGDNDHGQQGNGTTTVNRKPTLVQGLEGQKITRVACGSSHSVAWTTVDVTTPSVHEPVLFQTARDSLGASYLGQYLFNECFVLCFGFNTISSLCVCVQVCHQTVTLPR